MRGLEAEVRPAIARSPVERTDISILDVPAFDASALADALDERRAEQRPAGVAWLPSMRLKCVAAVGRLSRGRHCRRHPRLRPDRLRARSFRRRRQYRRRTHGRQSDAAFSRRPRRATSPFVAGSMLVRDHRERLEGFSAVDQ